MPRIDAWTSAELQVLYDHVMDPNYFPKVAAKLPGRTPTTIRNRMARLRDEARIDIKAVEWGLERRA